MLNINNLDASRQGRVLRACKRNQGGQAARNLSQLSQYQNKTPMTMLTWSAELIRPIFVVLRCRYSPENTRSERGLNMKFAIALRFPVSTDG